MACPFSTVLGWDCIARLVTYDPITGPGKESRTAVIDGWSHALLEE